MFNKKKRQDCKNEKLNAKKEKKICKKKAI